MSETLGSGVSVNVSVRPVGEVVSDAPCGGSASFNSAWAKAGVGAPSAPTQAPARTRPARPSRMRTYAVPAPRRRAPMRAIPPSTTATTIATIPITVAVVADDLASSAAFLLDAARSEEHTSELQSLAYIVCRLLLEKKNTYM